MQSSHLSRSSSYYMYSWLHDLYAQAMSGFLLTTAVGHNLGLSCSYLEKRESRGKSLHVHPKYTAVQPAHIVHTTSRQISDTSTFCKQHGSCIYHAHVLSKIAT